MDEVTNTSPKSTAPLLFMDSSLSSLENPSLAITLTYSWTMALAVKLVSQESSVSLHTFRLRA